VTIRCWPIKDIHGGARIAGVQMRLDVKILIVFGFVALSVNLAYAEEHHRGGDDGQTIYKSTCAVCHESLLMGAPVIGDKKDWGPRIAQGDNTLVDHAIHGIRGMPPKGGNSSLTDDEIKAAVEYMVNHSK